MAVTIQVGRVARTRAASTGTGRRAISTASTRGKFFVGTARRPELIDFAARRGARLQRTREERQLRAESAGNGLADETIWRGDSKVRERRCEVIDLSKVTAVGQASDFRST